ncbi:MAG: sigma 54-interacting transcriptional regulator [Myxococcales bacterium]|nr:sigma 54-interacting transcriptional regulator [Myxococcales bacterium]USN51740.1 MAG: sigma 54-interacting transcriptional regulator [Myxococcales bacterium]
MASIEISDAIGGKKSISLFKRLSIVGRGEGVDIELLDPNAPALAAYISQSGNSFTLSIPEHEPAALVKGFPSKKFTLIDNESFSLGSDLLTFRAHDQEHISTENKKNDEYDQVLAYKRLLNFSQRIAKEKDIDTLLSTLLKEITQLTGAEHGFLVLIEDGVPKRKVQESIDSKEPMECLSPMSDSIVKKVISQKEPVIISDALNDQEFSSSLSVINYRLTSVMCVPLIYQGHIFGAIYVANNSFTHAFNQKSLELMTIYSSQAAMLVQNALHINALKNHTKSLQDSLEFTKFGGLIGGCSSMQHIFRQVEKIASTDVNVLITGETGTGKEQIAREIHNRSLRKENSFIIVNCNAIPENLLESELFGHVRGAFSGATQSRIGKIQMAHNGTIFLDEISELPLHLQIKIMEVLSENRISKIGDNKSEEINIRVIAASNRDLMEMVKAQAFRQDLYYRLNIVQITAPPLRERGNDVLVIANFFLQKYAKIYGKEVIGLDQEAQNTILNFQWPGNIRQLENRIRRAVVMSDHNRISVNDLGIKADMENGILPLADALERFRSQYIHESLERNAHNRTKTAHELGVDPRTIFRHLEGLKKELDS